MAKPYPGKWIFRTMLFTAGHNRRYIEKAAESDADCVVLDLEDAVPPDRKAEARKLVREVLEADLFESKAVLVRINPMDTGLTLRDLDGVACAQLGGFVFPKAGSADDAKAFNAQLNLTEQTLGLENGHFDVVVLIESAKGVLNIHEIAESCERVVGLLFGVEDYFADTEAQHMPTGGSMLIPRVRTVLACRAAGIIPIDTPYVDVKNEEGFKEHLETGRSLGFEGLLVMTPSQVSLANEYYTPSDKALERASQMVRLAEEARSEGRGIAVFEGEFVSPPTEKQARTLLKRGNAIRDYQMHMRREE